MQNTVEFGRQADVHSEHLYRCGWASEVDR